MAKTKVRKKLTTEEAVRMGVEAAREWELERQKEEAQAKKEEALEREKEIFMFPLMERGFSKAEAEAAWKEHIKETAVAESTRVRMEDRRRIGRLF